MSLQRFEDIRAWQEARELVREVYAMTDGPGFSRDFGLKDQIRRASGSVMANIAEGFERRTRRDFRHFLGIALGSSAEVRSHLYIALDRGYVTQAQFDSAYNRALHASRLIYRFMRRISEGMGEERPT